jgi:hypothetical protein
MHPTAEPFVGQTGRQCSRGDDHVSLWQQLLQLGVRPILGARDDVPVALGQQQHACMELRARAMT